MTILKHTLFCALAILATSAYAQDSFDPTSLRGEEMRTNEAADSSPAFDMDGNYFLRPGHRRPGHGHPGHGHPGHGGPGYPGPVLHECVAGDAFGRGFVARGWASYGMLQRQALRSCYNYSRAPRSCRVRFCR